MKIQITTLPAFGNVNISVEGITVICGNNNTGKSQLAQEIGKTVRDRRAFLIDSSSCSYRQTSTAIMNGITLSERTDLLKDLCRIAGGTYYFRPGDMCPFFQYQLGVDTESALIPIDSTAKGTQSLTGLAFYIQNNFNSGDLIVINTPEAGLHPENQRKVARLLARVVNCGIKMVITTHSDYIVKEVNTLIMLNRKTPYLKKLAEEEGYQLSELLSPEQVNVYTAERSGFGCELNEVEVDENMGIEIKSFDTTIEAMNRIQEAIVWGE